MALRDEKFPGLSRNGPPGAIELSHDGTISGKNLVCSIFYAENGRKYNRLQIMQPLIKLTDKNGCIFTVRVDLIVLGYQCYYVAVKY